MEGYDPKLVIGGVIMLFCILIGVAVGAMLKCDAAGKLYRNMTIECPCAANYNQIPQPKNWTVNITNLTVDG